MTMNANDRPPRHVVAAAALVSNGRGDVLMVRSPLRGWEFPGGQVEEGESLLDGLKREILEETGVTASIGSLAGVYVRTSHPALVVMTFLGGYESGELRTSAESLEVEWTPRQEALQRISHPAVYDRMKDLLAFDGRVMYRAYALDPYRVLEERTL